MMDLAIPLVALAVLAVVLVNRFHAPPAGCSRCDRRR